MPGETFSRMPMPARRALVWDMMRAYHAKA